MGHAYKTSPYYGSLWRELGFQPASICHVGELGRLPVVTKDIIEKEKDRMVSSAFHGKDLVRSYTGGSSGNPTSFFSDRSCTARRVGHQLAILERCNHYVGDRVGLIWGASRDLQAPEASPGWKGRLRRYSLGRETLCCNRMDTGLLRDYYHRVKAFRPHVLYGYPNAMAELARLIREEGLDPIHVRTVICTAERLSEEHRVLLQETFSGEVFNLYCTREHGCIGFECKEHRGYHIDTGSVHLEISPREEGAVRTEAGDILVTDLLNRGMPLVRNRTGDRGRLSEEPCPCGSPLPLLERLEGRVSDLLYGSDGSLVPGLLLLDMFQDVPEIRDLQIVQEKRKEVTLVLVVTEGFCEALRKRVVQKTQEFLGAETEVKVRVVTEIPRNPNSGKVQEVRCHVRPEGPS